MSTLYIKNMVCHRCVMAVSQILENQGLHPEKVALGEVTIKEDHLSDKQKADLDAALSSVGFERIDDRKARLIEAIKNNVIRLIHPTDKVNLKFNWSDILSDALHYDYNYLSNLFSSVEGITLEQYIIRQKIEKVKEMLFYDELSLSEIAHRLGYSSVAHLSNQFKKVIGVSPSKFKNSRSSGSARQPIDSI